VLRVKARGQRDLITVLGHAAVISAGEFVQASGTWINDRTQGVQFRASFLKALCGVEPGPWHRDLYPAEGPQQRPRSVAGSSFTGRDG
jgi:hypothetical protein